jgi:hypothetical protein
MKQLRKGSRVVLGLLWVLWGATAEGAAPEHFNFTLKMSEDKKLCPAITEVLAAEYNDHWIQDSPRHEWFIKWEPLRSFDEQFRNEPRFSDDYCSIYRWAQFDIDNDGQAELVVKWSSCLGGIRSDTLYIFRSEEPSAGIYETIMNKFPPSDSPQAKANQERLLGQISYTGQWYELKKLPPFKDDRGRSQLHGIGGKVWIHPFMFDGQTYLNLHGLSGMHVIARYRRDETKSTQLEDVCYVNRKKL